jgi:hypothetical protein
MRDKDNLRTRGPHGLDSIVVGYYRGKELVYENLPEQLGFG